MFFMITCDFLVVRITFLLFHKHRYVCVNLYAILYHENIIFVHYIDFMLNFHDFEESLFNIIKLLICYQICWFIIFSCYAFDINRKVVVNGRAERERSEKWGEGVEPAVDNH